MYKILLTCLVILGIVGQIALTPLNLQGLTLTVNFQGDPKTLEGYKFEVILENHSSSDVKDLVLKLDDVLPHNLDSAQAYSIHDETDSYEATANRSNGQLEVTVKVGQKKVYILKGVH